MRIASGGNNFMSFSDRSLKSNLASLMDKSRHDALSQVEQNYSSSTTGTLGELFSNPPIAPTHPSTLPLRDKAVQRW